MSYTRPATDEDRNRIADPDEMVVRVVFVSAYDPAGTLESHQHQDLSSAHYFLYQESIRRIEEKMNHDLAHAKRIRDEKMHTLKKQAFGHGDLEINYAYQVEIPKDLEPNEKATSEGLDLKGEASGYEGQDYLTALSEGEDLKG